MKIAFSATNPCHLYPLARAAAEAGATAVYYSGYPLWKLEDPGALQVRSYAWRTTLVYALLKYLPENRRPRSRSLFTWQDRAFDQWVGRHLQQADFVHGLPGQCLETFRAAEKLGIRRVLNHATGPVREWVRIMEPEYSRVGLRLADVCSYDAEYFAREDEEYALADYHAAASTIVRDQLVQAGVPAHRIWLVPYGADPKIFHPGITEKPSAFRIVFAGQVGLRKGLRTLLNALTQVHRPDWQMHFYGARLGEAETDLRSYTGVTPLEFHGSVSQARLADAFRGSSVLVLPSLEEGYGLVVPQALHSGLPCIVADRVGAKDLIKHRENGSIFAALDASALAQELSWWSTHLRRVDDAPEWACPAQRLLSYSATALGG